MRARAGGRLAGRARGRVGWRKSGWASGRTDGPVSGSAGRRAGGRAGGRASERTDGRAEIPWFFLCGIFNLVIVLICKTWNAIINWSRTQKKSVIIHTCMCFPCFLCFFCTPHHLPHLPQPPVFLGTPPLRPSSSCSSFKPPSVGDLLELVSCVQ